MREMTGRKLCESAFAERGGTLLPQLSSLSKLSVGQFPDIKCTKRGDIDCGFRIFYDICRNFRRLLSPRRVERYVAPSFEGGGNCMRFA